MQAISLWLFSFSVPCLACSMVLVGVFSFLMRLPLPVHGSRDDDVKADTNYQPHHHSESNQPRLNLWLWVRSQCSTQAFKLQCVISQLKNPIDATSGQPNMTLRKGNFPLFKSDQNPPSHSGEYLKFITHPLQIHIHIESLKSLWTIQIIYNHMHKSDKVEWFYKGSSSCESRVCYKVLVLRH